MELEVFEIVGEAAYYVAPSTYYNGKELYINKEKVSSELIKKGYTFSKKDVFEYMPTSKNLLHYEKGGVKMSVKEYNSKPRYFDEDDEDDVIMTAIENRKLLEGFIPIYEDLELKKVKIIVCGKIQNTKSDFIKCSVTHKEGKSFLYSVNVNNVTIDEYRKLSIEYSAHAKFEKIDRSYLRFYRVNGNYIFGDHYPFSEYSGTKVFKDLKEAQNTEQEIRNDVKNTVLKNVFKNNLSDDKKSSILNYLANIKKAKDKKMMINMIDILILDLKEYEENIKI